MRDIFFFTDIHGMYDLYRAIMNYCLEQDPECIIIFGGDAIDRGKDGYKIMKELLDNPQVIYLMGNHEDMFCRSAREIKEKLNFTNMNKDDIQKTLNECYIFNGRYNHIQNSLYNGGMQTLIDWIIDGASMEIIERIEKLPRTFVYGNIDFCHAASTYNIFEQGNTAEYYNKPMPDYVADSLIWSRSNMNYGWQNGRTVVFGHTPTVALSHFIECNIKKNEPTIPYKWTSKFNKEMQGKKLDMDTWAFGSGRAFVLNVLTMQAQGFEDVNFKNEEIREHNVKKIEVIQF